MGSVSEGLAAAARSRGAEIETGAEVVAVETDGTTATVRTADGRTVHAGQVLANVAPFVLARLLGEPSPAPAPEGSQLKINMLLSRLPRLRDARVTPEQAFCGTFHINEGYDQLERAYRQAAAGEVPELPPCEVYCHSLTDPSILSPALRDAGVQTLTLFGLHMPARLFRDDPVATLARAREATLASVNSVLAEPIEDCLLDASTIETIGPLEVEAKLGMPGGHIFHGDLQWPFAERAEDVGRWGVETAAPERLRVRRRRPSWRWRQRHPRPQRGQCRPRRRLTLCERRTVSCRSRFVLFALTVPASGGLGERPLEGVHPVPDDA